MSSLSVDPGHLLPLGRDIESFAGRVAPGSLAAALAAGVAALGGLSSAEALGSVAAVWVPVMRQLAAEWQAWGRSVCDAGASYDAVEREVERAAS